MEAIRCDEAVAKAERGCRPRWLSGEQAFWTLVGTGEDEREGLLCEDGTIEPHKRGFTIQPVMRVGGELVTHDEARVSQSLERGYLPLPSVEWMWGQIRLTEEVLAWGGRESSVYARYEIRNEGAGRRKVRLYLMIQPMQVYPPWQGGHDGFSRICKMKYDGGAVHLDGGRKVALATPPDAFAAKGDARRVGDGLEGDIAECVVRDVLPTATEAEDGGGLVSGVAMYGFDLGPGEAMKVFVAVPLHGRDPEWHAGMTGAQLRASYDAMRAERIEYWESKVSRVDIRVPERAITDTLKANIAYNLITRDGVGFQPGSRSYDKSWMRDGGSQALALLKMGFREEVREFIEWIGGYQFDTGEIAPIIDTKREDPLWEEKAGLCEYDSQGQFVHAVRMYYQFTGDRAFVEAQYPRVVSALKFLAQLRGRRCTPEYRDGPAEKRACYGILPESRSYEPATPGSPFHTYWDDFWALAGWEDGRAIAENLGDARMAAWMRDEYVALRGALCDSMDHVNRTRHTEGLPSFVEVDAFEPAFTVGALAHGGQLDAVPKVAVEATLDRYDRLLRERLEVGAKFVFAPYEFMMVSALLRMGQRDRALATLRFLLRYRRPVGWNQFAEVVDSDCRFPRNIGDMPHAWAGAEYIEAVRSLFVFERGGQLVVGAGIDPAWLGHGEVVSVAKAPTGFGLIDFEMRAETDGVRVRLGGEARPPCGILLKSPVDGAHAQMSRDGRTWGPVPSEGIAIECLPVEILIRGYR